MELSQFSEKLNKVDGKVYVIEEKIQMPESGVYEAMLQHDNINEVTLTVYTGPQLTGEQLQSYALSTPSLTPWKRSIRIQASVPVVYICYETDGDTVEADDVNGLQRELVRTQQSVTDETDRAQAAESALGEAVQKEAERASAAEQSLTEVIQEEAQRAEQAEKQIRQEIDQNRPNWDEAYSKQHTHKNGSVLEKLTQAMLDKLEGIAEGANKYIHPVTPGNKHVPAGGKAGQILKWHADGEAEWASDSGDTKVTQKPGTVSNDKRLILSASAGDNEETSYVVKSPNFTANPVTGEFYAKGYRRIDLTGQTLDADTLTLASGAPQIMRYIEKTSGGAAKIINIPVSGQPFLLDVELIRWASVTDYVTMQTFRSVGQKNLEYVRYCTSGTWSAWTARAFTDTKYTHPSSGVKAGTYRSVTVNAQGHVTGGSNPTTLAGYGITDAAAKSHSHDGVYLKKGSMTWADLGGGSS